MEDEFYCVKQHSPRVIGMNLDDISAMNKIGRSRMLTVIERTPGVDPSELTLIPRFGEAIHGS